MQQPRTLSEITPEEMKRLEKKFRKVKAAIIKQKGMISGQDLADAKLKFLAKNNISTEGLS